MTVLKALANSLLSLLLFLCLSIMGLAITLNATVLSSGFITSQINKLDVVAIADEVAVPELQEMPELSDHPEVVTSIQNAIAHNEAALKSHVNSAVNDIYGYLVDGKPLDLRQALSKSVLDPQLAISILNDLDLTTVLHDLLVSDLPLESAVIGSATVDLTPYIDSIVPVIEPWFKEQAALLIPQVYDYLLGKSQSLNLSIPLGTVSNDVGSALKSAILASPPSSLAGLSQAQLAQEFDKTWAQTVQQFPEALVIDSGELELDQQAEINQALDDAQQGLSTAREYVGWYQTGFWGLVGLTALLILFIILVNRNVKGTSRVLGSTLTTYGVLEAAGVIAARVIAHSQLPPLLTDVPQSVQPWLLQMTDSLSLPLLIFSLACAVVGITLLVVSFLYKRRQIPAAQPETLPPHA